MRVYHCSVILDMPELLRIWKSLTQSLSVFDVTGICAYSGIENIFQREFSQEETAYNSHAFWIFIITPQGSQIGDCVDDLLLLFQVPQKLVIVHLETLRNLFNERPILLNKRYDSLAVILGDVFRLVLDLLRFNNGLVLDYRCLALLLSRLAFRLH